MSTRQPFRHRSRSLLRVALVAVLLGGATPAAALTDSDQDWFGPQQGDFELSGTVSFATLFNSEVTGLDGQLNFGFFFTDWLEGGISLSMGWFTRSSTGQQSSPLTNKSGEKISSRALSLTSGPAVTLTGPEFYGGMEGWFRFFPFTAIWDQLLPESIAPFVQVEFGPLFASDVSPFLNFSVSMGLNIYLTEQVALSPEFGYGFIHATDSSVDFSKRPTGNNRESSEHLFGFNISLAFFFTA